MNEAPCSLFTTDTSNLARYLYIVNWEEYAIYAENCHW